MACTFANAASVQIGARTVLERCSVGAHCRIGAECVISDVELAPHAVIPPRTLLFVLHTRHHGFAPVTLAIDDDLKGPVDAPTATIGPARLRCTARSRWDAPVFPSGFATRAEASAAGVALAVGVLPADRPRLSLADLLKLCC
eukprot:Unigene6123_Nuclearia_a/m.18853 Unigene6123_Nuclearia_a/g.18853  ORF Unigene6123_Nuclearia_a/g.18853 Unigene6123_Nuclearia_a/m.18853 type:complete len:143 (+) Unigene6123_Nuclearia_a:1195-1623(+)